MKTIFYLLISMIFVGCSSVPPEASDLSIELGKRISAVEESNIKLLHKFFDQKREAVDTFIQDEWVPVFAEEVFATPLVANAWNTIVQENDSHQRVQLLVRLGPRLQAKINAKRQELVRPLDDLERSIETSLRSEYNQMRSMNNTITSFLISASEVEENRSRYLEMIGVTEEKIGKVIDDTDFAVSTLLGAANEARDKVDRGSEFIGKIESFIDSMR